MLFRYTLPHKVSLNPFMATTKSLRSKSNNAFPWVSAQPLLKPLVNMHTTSYMSGVTSYSFSSFFHTHTHKTNIGQKRYPQNPPFRCQSFKIFLGGACPQTPLVLLRASSTCAHAAPPRSSPSPRSWSDPPFFWGCWHPCLSSESAIDGCPV